MGQACIILAKQCGLQVIATTRSEKKSALLHRLGADTVIVDNGEISSEVLLIYPEGVDHVIEVGGPGTLTQSITACRTGGHIALIGVLTGFAGEVSIRHCFQIRFVSTGSPLAAEQIKRT